MIVVFPGLFPGRAHLAAGAQGTSCLRSSSSISACRSNSCSRLCRLESSWANRASRDSSLLSTLENESKGISEGIGAFCRGIALWTASEPVLGVLPWFVRANSTKSQGLLSGLFGHFLVQRSWHLQIQLQNEYVDVSVALNHTHYQWHRFFSYMFWGDLCFYL